MIALLRNNSRGNKSRSRESGIIGGRKGTSVPALKSLKQIIQKKGFNMIGCDKRRIKRFSEAARKDGENWRDVDRRNLGAQENSMIRIGGDYDQEKSLLRIKNGKESSLPLHTIAGCQGQRDFLIEQSDLKSRNHFLNSNHTHYRLGDLLSRSNNIRKEGILKMNRTKTAGKGYSFIDLKNDDCDSKRKTLLPRKKLGIDENSKSGLFDEVFAKKLKKELDRLNTKSHLTGAAIRRKPQTASQDKVLDKSSEMLKINKNRLKNILKSSEKTNQIAINLERSRNNLKSSNKLRNRRGSYNSYQKNTQMLKNAKKIKNAFKNKSMLLIPYPKVSPATNQKPLTPLKPSEQRAKSNSILKRLRKSFERKKRVGNRDENSIGFLKPQFNTLNSNSRVDYYRDHSVEPKSISKAALICQPCQVSHISAPNYSKSKTKKSSSQKIKIQLFSNSRSKHHVPYSYKKRKRRQIINISKTYDKIDITIDEASRSFSNGGGSFLREKDYGNYLTWKDYNTSTISKGEKNQAQKSKSRSKV